MSTISKFQDTDFEGDPTSQRRSIMNSSSNQEHLNLGSQFDDGSSSIDNDEVLQMEIKQLKRENQFLKKKISELTQGNKTNRLQKRNSTKKGYNSQNKDQINMTVQFFFEQINTLLKSVVEMFRLELTPSEKVLFDTGFVEDQEINPLKKYSAIKKHTLNRQLQKIMLQPQENRYINLLGTFTTFYKAKEESDTYVKSVVDDLSKKALNLNKMIVEKAHRKNLRRSDAKSQLISERVTIDKKIGSQHTTSSKYNIISRKEILQDKLFRDLDENDRNRISRGLQRVM